MMAYLCLSLYPFRGCTCFILCMIYRIYTIVDSLRRRCIQFQRPHEKQLRAEKGYRKRPPHLAAVPLMLISSFLDGICNCLYHHGLLLFVFHRNLNTVCNRMSSVQLQLQVCGYLAPLFLRCTAPFAGWMILSVSRRLQYSMTASVPKFRDW
jgi:hypothetical protein